jgi:hypothetical protein
MKSAFGIQEDCASYRQNTGHCRVGLAQRLEGSRFYLLPDPPHDHAKNFGAIQRLVQQAAPVNVSTGGLPERRSIVRIE